MATTLITLPADEDFLKRAERVAAKMNTTVVSMLATALDAISDLDFDERLLPPITRSALGIAKEIPNRPYKELLLEVLEAGQMKLLIDANPVQPQEFLRLLV